ncbi:hypothetical protein [Sphingomonas sp.]|uniref:hypothetical protein n=1 Tax=Sphingomonas sp. TaxID=28214 RepID=UPI001EC1CE51|nr:hypothetical protein [Sphingomonas sp.]MBX3594766.1 hypothetical protein [Sphingomonas sp.]
MKMLVAALALMLQTATAPAPAPAPSPAPEAARLGRELAATGPLATVLPMIAEKETGEMLADHSDWSEADRAAFRATARRVYADGRDRLIAAIGAGYAKRLSVADLKTLLAAARSKAAGRRRAVEPMVIAEAMQSLGQLDFKGDVRKAWCAAGGRDCPLN